MLLLRIASTHIRNRLRQTIVSTLGVALGVGFSVAMASLMVASTTIEAGQLIEPGMLQRVEWPDSALMTYSGWSSLSSSGRSSR